MFQWDTYRWCNKNGRYNRRKTNTTAINESIAI